MRATIITDSIVDSEVAGAIKYWTYAGSTDAKGFNFKCPCGCGALGSVRFGANGWTWDGSVLAPTITPSIDLSKDGTSHWHGWLKQGEWVK
jgi:hypothetical protein